MKKLIILSLFCIFLASCYFDPDKRSIIIIKQKQFSRNQESGRYRYLIDISYCSGGMNNYFYSDSSYEIGDTLKIVKNR